MAHVGRVAIVTGGAQGIGLAIATVLLEEGCKVCVADINDDKAKETVHQLNEKFGAGRAFFAHCDVTSEEQYEETFKKTIDEFGQIDILINNAGIVLEQNPRKVLEVNLLGPIFGCQMALKFMGTSHGGKGGAVINTASLAGLVVHPSIPSYVASKHGVVGLTRSYGHSYHFLKNKVTFCALCPSYVRTDMIEKSKNCTLGPEIDVTERPDLMEPSFVAKGVLQLLKDGRNGATLIVTKQEGYQYIEVQSELKDLMV